MSPLVKGGGYLFETIDSTSIFTPEDFDDEHRMVAESLSSFLAEKVFANMDAIEAKQEGLMKELLVEAGEYGFLGMDIEEKYGGTETDEICSTIIAEKLGPTGAFAVGHGGHTGIGNLPIVYFGNEEQKAAYLPVIATAEKISCYALTEPGSGSDALSAKTRAVLADDKSHYIINGSKTFITNAGIADILIVYAKVDGEKFTAFIVDGDSEGLSIGAEEVKMGLKGSSTCSVFFDNVKVPAENLLFEIGKGHVVAFNILNIGRHKIAANSVGAAKYALDQTVAYANERKQFNMPIGKFGLIKEKLAEMAIRIYAAESTVYRTAGILNEMMESLPGDHSGQVLANGIAEYALECSLEKVFASEVEGYVVDEAVQIHGGYGYIAEYPVERLYRDARIRRIFEGTNEINRTIIPTTLIKRAGSGALPLIEESAGLIEKLKAQEVWPARETPDDIVQACKDVFLFCIGHGHEKLADKLLKNQEILGHLADIAIFAYAMESSLLRARKAEANNGRNRELKNQLATAFIHSSMTRVVQTAVEIIANLASGSTLRQLRNDLIRLTNFEPFDIITVRATIADTISAAGKYEV
jgi:alkylation response protein AidB-like acyl-CoA dehydrogenase